MKSKRAIGVCVGASSVSLVELNGEPDNYKLVRAENRSHDGAPKKAIEELFASEDFSDASFVATGKKFKDLLNARTIPEPEAVETAARRLGYAGDRDCVLIMGAENFFVYSLQSDGGVDNVFAGNKCASGTGEFFLQQIGRMNLTVEEATETAAGQEPHHVSGRCSVFCKSDCTHALNKGVPKPQVVSGLNKMIAEKAVELLSKRENRKPLAIGGVTRNTGTVDFIRDLYPDLVVPEEALYFEAYGAALVAAQGDHRLDVENPFQERKNIFPTLPSLDENAENVEFKTIQHAEARPGEVALLGLDVGSTTTKAVVIRVEDKALLASVYLRTNGDPVGASRACYREIRSQLPDDVKIVGLGTTGSGRQVAGLHAFTEGVINEIIAHAAAAAHFDPSVDTIFEIGGQDAKYTFLTNGVASDYAMNEACSAGTGSFLEEAAKESLRIDYRDIADIAVTAEKPINFNDQCSAFISSDVKTALQNGYETNDVVAGLVYSICMNYVNRVKGQRETGEVVFMQGGVCYNRAVPIAMARLTGKKIIVPPEPGLMGAYGVALEVGKRIELGLLERGDFRLDELIERDFKRVSSFICPGGAEKCDLKCDISMIEIDGKRYPFGGACNKYDNIRFDKKTEKKRDVNYVERRQKMVFEEFVRLPKADGPAVAIPKSFLTNTLYPFYHHFFTKLGFRVELESEVDQEGVDKIESAFCYPAEISHGLFFSAMKKKPEYIFVPHIMNMTNPDSYDHNKACVLVQTEPYYLRTTFREELKSELLAPLLNFSETKQKVFDAMWAELRKTGVKKSEAKTAFFEAYDILDEMYAAFRKLGKEALALVESEPDSFAIVVFGRAYNTFAREANMGIPRKLASKNLVVIPHDILPSENLETYDHMYWNSGHLITRNARLVQAHRQLYGVFVTNFSCGPDSFVVPFFRRIMGKKPSLTLELDSHSADVGVDTRIEAALDIIRNYRELVGDAPPQERPTRKPLEFVTTSNGDSYIEDDEGNRFRLDDPDVEMLIPSMGSHSSEAFAALFRSMGVNARALPVPDFETLQTGKGHATGKECLPYILTTGSLLEYAKKRNGNGKKALFFMPNGYGPCRQGLYYVAMKNVLKDMNYSQFGVMSLNDETSFRELGDDFHKKGWLALSIADVVIDMRNALLALAVDRDAALETFDKEWADVLVAMERGNQDGIFAALEVFAENLRVLHLKMPLSEAKVVSLIGEIYVRREEYSRLDLMTTLADRGFVVRTAPITEYVYYTNHLIKNRLTSSPPTLKERLAISIKDKYQVMIERRVKRTLAKSGLSFDHLINVGETFDKASHLMPPALQGESILTTGLALREILDEACGVISIGPFNCMPGRFTEAILNKEMTMAGKVRSNQGRENGFPKDIDSLPFLYLETDGSAYPQIAQSKLEVFMMRAEQVHEKLRRAESVL